MVDYTHWLVTKGENPCVVKRRGMVPVVLTPVGNDRRRLRRLVQQEVDNRIRIFLQDDSTSMELLRASTRPYVTQLLGDLWLREVRLLRREPGMPDFYLPNDGEGYIYWTLVGREMPPDWQGPADGVIPAETPVTIFSMLIQPTRFKLVDD